MGRNKTASEIATQYRMRVGKSKTLAEIATAIKLNGMWEEIDSIINPKQSIDERFKQLPQWGEYYYDDEQPIS